MATKAEQRGPGEKGLKDKDWSSPHTQKECNAWGQNDSEKCKVEHIRDLIILQKSKGD